MVPDFHQYVPTSQIIKIYNTSALALSEGFVDSVKADLVGN